MTSRSLITVVLCLRVCVALAQEEEKPWYSGITVHGFASAGYSYNFNNPAQGVNQFRVFDFDNNTLKVDVVELVVQKGVTELGDAGFRVDMAAGSSIPRITAARGLFRNEVTGEAQDFDLQQLFLSYIVPVGTGLRIDAGKYVTHTGMEVIEGYDGYNNHYTRSFLFGYAIPFTHTGVKATYVFHKKLTGMLMVANGWDNVTDNNGSKTWGGQLVFTPHSTFTLYTNLCFGAERDENDDDSRRLLDLVALWNPNSTLSIGLNFDYGSEENATAPGKDATWKGLAGYFRYNITSRFALAFRVERFSDSDGTRTGIAQNLTEFTVTPELKITDHLFTRMDFRFDSSSEKAFSEEGDGAFTDSQSTVAWNLLYLF